MGIRHLQEKGPRIIRTCQVINMLDRLMRHLFIKINLNRAMTYPRNAHRAGIVCVALSLMLLIGDPCKNRQDKDLLSDVFQTHETDLAR